MRKEKLKHKFIRGNQSAFNIIYKDFSNAMFAICLRYAKNEHEAADILQDAFLKIYQNRKSFDPKQELQGWIKTIVVNTAINHYRKNKKFILISDNNYFDDEVEEDFELLNQPNISQILTNTLKELPDGYRVIFNLYVIENLTHIEISQYLGITVSTSKSQLSRAKKMLVKLLLKQNINLKTISNEERA